jgi:signal transduction histidine kinase
MARVLWPQYSEGSERSGRFLAGLTSILGAPTEELDECIREALGRLAGQAGAERSSFGRFSEDGTSATITHSYGTPQIPTPSRIELRWYLQQLRQGQCLRMGRLPDDLPDEAEAERELFRSTGVRSHLAVPIFRAGQIWGVLELATFRRSRAWTADEMECFRLAGEMMMAAALRGELEETVRRQREELAHVARVATLGDLAAALAHELNQPLTAIRANAQAAQRLLARAEIARDLGEILDDIVGDATRATDLIRRLDALLRRRELEKVPVDVNQAVRDIHAVISAMARRHGATLVLRLASGLPPVMADPVQLQQVVLNLVGNAAEAMAGNEPGARRVVVATSAAARQVSVSVEDAGPPIDDATLDRFFTPFYTTKPHGLGMGLTISRSIVEAHGGRLQAQRRPGRGLVMRMLLPAERGGAPGGGAHGGGRAGSV